MTNTNHMGIGVHLKVRDIKKSREFYEGVLGFAPLFGYGDATFRRTLPSTIPSVLQDGLPGAPEAYCGVTYEPVPNAPFEIANGHIAVADKSVFDEPIRGPKVSAMLKVNSLVPLIREKNVRPGSPVRHYYWGTIEMVLKDPDDFVIVVIAPYSESELKEVSKFVAVKVVKPNA